MIKILLCLFLLFSFSKASYKVVENENIFMLKINNENFQEILLKLKDEINFEGFVIVYELNLAKSTNEVAVTLGKNSVLKEKEFYELPSGSKDFRMKEFL